MAGINVGSAFVTIVPSARGFKGALRRELSGELEQLGKNAGKTLEKGIQKAKIKQTLDKAFNVASVATLIASLASVSGAAVSLGASLLPLAGSLTALPAAAGVGVAALAALKIGMSGVGDAFSAFASGNAKKFREALDALTPAARRFVKDFTGAFKGIKSSVQEAMFKPISKVSAQTAKALAGPLKKGLTDVGSALGDAGAKVVKFAGSSKGVQTMSNAFSNAETFIDGASKGLDPLLNGVADLANVLFPKMGKAGEGVGNSMSKLGKWMTKISQNGDALGWLDGAKKTFKKVWNIAKSLLSTILGIFGASDTGDILGSLGKMADKMDKWVNSAEGQDKLGEIFKTLKQVLEDLGSVLGTVGGGIGLLLGWFQKLPGPVQSVVTKTLAFGAAARLLKGPLSAVTTAGSGVISFFSKSGKEASTASKLWSGMKTAASSTASGVKSAASAMSSAASSMASGIKTGVSKAGTLMSSLGSKAGSAASTVGSKLKPIGSSISTAASKAGTAISGLGSKAGSAASTVGSKVASMGAKFGSMAASAASASLKVVASFAKMTASAVAAAAKSIAQLAALGAKWVWYGIMAMANAVRAAAAWVISLGPIAWIIAAVIALVVLIIAYWDEIVAALEVAWNWVADMAKTIWGGIVAFFTSLWEGVVAVFQFVWNLIVTIITTYINTVILIVTTVFTAVWTFIQMVWNGIVTAIKAAWAFIVAAVTSYINMVITVVTTVFNAVWAFIQMVWAGIVAAIRAAWAFIKSVVTTGINAVKAVVTSIFNAIKSVISTVWNAIKSVIKGAIDKVKSTIQTLSSIPGKVKAFFQRAKDGAVEKLQALISWARGVPGKVLSALGNVGSKLLGAGKNLIKGLLNGMKNAAGSIWSWLKGLLSGMKDKVLGFFGIKSPSRLMMYVGDMIVQGLVKGLDNGETAALRAADRLANAAKPDVDTQFGMGLSNSHGPGGKYNGSGTYVEKLEIQALGRPYNIEETTAALKYKVGV